MHELQELTKKLLGYGARVPKELMLFVKNMMFLDGAIARLAPDLDILERDPAGAHRDRARATASGSPPSSASIPRSPTEFDMDAVKAAHGLSADVETLTYRDVQERRELIQQRSGREAQGCEVAR